MKKRFSLFLCLVLTGLSACGRAPQPPTQASPVTANPVDPLASEPTPDAFPQIERRPAPAQWERGKLSPVPRYDPELIDTWQMDLRDYDLSTLDLSDSLEDLYYASFDDQTLWPPPERMPAEFNRQQIMDLGKNPGLGIRELHAQGITGQGVGIAIIDQPLITEHQEYADRLQLYEELNIEPGTESQMHGPAVASIAVGKTVGVAPEADLYYIGAWNVDWKGGGDFEWNFTYYAQAIRRILELNQQLPAGRKIRVIAMQTGWSPEQGGYEEITQAAAEAKQAGLLVISSSVEATHGFKFHGLGRFPLADPDEAASYEPGMFWAGQYYAGEQFSDRLLVPMDSRTTASPGGADEYVFYRQGGWSWAIPYIAGVYALSAQVNPEITPDEFWEVALRTGQTIELQRDGQAIRLGPIIDPSALIAELQQ